MWSIDGRDIALARWATLSLFVDFRTTIRAFYGGFREFFLAERVFIVVVGVLVVVRVVIHAFLTRVLPEKTRFRHPSRVIGWVNFAPMDNSFALWAFTVSVLNIVLGSAVTVHAVLWKRDARAVIGWVGLAWLAPFVGSLAYFTLGINRIRRANLSNKLQAAWEHQELRYTPADIEDARGLAELHPHFAGLVSLGKSITNRSILPGNKIEPLVNGDALYPVMLRAIEEAKRSVTLLSYIFDSDPTGDQFFDALVAAHRRGLEVRVLIDDVGSRYCRPNMALRLQAAGVPTATFLPTRLPRLPKYTNLRNHRKIMVIDGELGFTGGTNIRHFHVLNANPSFPIACVHFQVEGPVVRHLQEAFAVDWAFVTDETLAGEPWFVPLERVGTVWARGVPHGPDEDFEKLMYLMAGALSVARSRVRIVTPYFLPDASLIYSLNSAAMRGTQVEIYIPEKNNIPLVQWASAAQLWQNVEKGCQVFSVPPPFDHSKLMVVDDFWTLIGSTNWDSRSLRLNFEFNVECYDEGLAARVNSIIDAKAAQARLITLDELDSRSLPIRLRDGLSRLMTPYL